jgi:hypothetical protein
MHKQIKFEQNLRVLSINLQNPPIEKKLSM